MSMGAISSATSQRRRNRQKVTTSRVSSPSRNISGKGMVGYSSSSRTNCLNGRASWDHRKSPSPTLGLLGYRAYWQEKIVELLLDSEDEVSLDEIAQKTAITHGDIMHT